MNRHEITYSLRVALFSDDEAKKLEEFSELLTRDEVESRMNVIWEYDKSLGGLGGYAMPSDPVINPFNTWGRDRNLFRSVQYAKSSLVNYPTHPRSVIVDVGRSLEITCKYIVDQYSLLSRFKNKDMLGKNIERLHDKGIIDDELYESCKLLAVPTNVAKHVISEKTPRTFSEFDGVVAYFSLRKIHNRLLDIINHPLRHKDFAVYVDK